MTHPTKAIYRSLLSDFIKVSYNSFENSLNIRAIDSEDQLYDSKDLTASLDRVEAVDFHSTVEIDGIRFTPYHAGHVLGAAMYFIEIAGVKVLSALFTILILRYYLQETIQEKTIECLFLPNFPHRSQIF